MKYDITALGEILIDFTPTGKDSDGDLTFARKAGGAPFNLLATVSKFGGKTAFIGKVGNDMFGSFLRTTLKEYNISQEGLVTDNIHNTTLAFVALNENGDRDFSFYRNFGADIFLQKEDINKDIIENSAIFHFGSLSLCSDMSKEATEYALGTALQSGCIITYDPNYRQPLWENRDTAVKMMKLPLDKVDILKISKDELFMLFGEDLEIAITKALSYGIKIILVTDGTNGAAVYMKNAHRVLPAEKVTPVDTTGAGDIFFGTFLSEWIKNKSTLENADIDTVTRYLQKAISVAGKSTLRHGAAASIPNENEL